MANQINGFLSPFLRKKRLNNALPFIKGKVLDYGCGTGLLAEYITKNKYVGLDIDQESINIAKILHPGYRFFKIINTVSKEITKSGPFDTIVMLAVIEHLAGPKRTLMDLSKILSPSGKLVITTPHPVSNNIHRLGSKIGLFSREAEEQHQKLYNYQDLNRLCLEAGMKIIRYKRFLLNLNQLFILEKS
jgi:2-polyprenyl-3-methyl-5-hydroxy-6-metoxy-1,4-benzoquinol methylase